MNLTSSVEQYDLLHIYCGEPSEWFLPPEILELCLSYAGLIGRSRRHTFFWIYQ